MFHLAAYSESQDTAGVIVPCAAIADPSLTVSGDNIQVPDFAPNLLGAWATGITISRAQLQSPSLRRNVNYEIIPLSVGAVPVSNEPLFYKRDFPIPLDGGEQMQAYVAETAAGAERETVLVWFSDGPIQPVNGEVYSVRVTAAQTLTAFTWTNGSLTFDQALPVGRYAIVGAHFVSAGLMAFRFLLQGQTARPGGIGSQSAAAYATNVQRDGGLGSWGEFEHNTPPTVDFLSQLADTSETGVLDLVKVS